MTAALRVPCDGDCGTWVDRPYTGLRFRGRPMRLCPDCLQRFARSVAMVDRAVRRRAA